MKINEMMKLHYIKLVVLLQLVVGINCGSVLESNGTSGKDIDATDLIALGREINEPFISLIGQVINNYHTCTEWSNWTECGAVKTDHYSTTTRTRHCGVDRHEETQINVCEGAPLNRTTKSSCPQNYEVTENGFCMKLYTERKTRIEAESLCTNDGGFVINIDSDEKHADVKAILTTNDIQDNILIDGRRKNPASQWKYSYGSGSGYFRWYSSFPHSDKNDQCLLQTGRRSVENQRFQTFNHPCSDNGLCMCEVLIE